MARIRLGASLLFLAFSLLGVAGTASAQDASIVGTAKDDSGAVLPGVTVTVASPALLEQQRVTITDGEGRYLVTQLRPGTYSVKFELQGLRTVVREGVQLSAGFAATVDGNMQVGSVAETITVTGQAPVVDVQNVRRQTVVSNELLEQLPTSTKHISNLTTLTTGVTGIADVGGAYQVEPGQDVVSGGGAFHGKSGTKVSLDGMGIENSSGNSSYQLNAAAVEEMVMSTSGISADTNADGMVVNIIPKEGSNTFKSTLAGQFSNAALEASNLDDAIRARGIQTPTKTLRLYDGSFSLGGPVKRDKLWFFTALRTWGFARQQSGVFWNKTQGEYLTPANAERKVVRWTPWVDRPEDRLSGRLEWYQSALTRMTYQATPRNKFAVTYDEQRGCNCGSLSASTAQEAYVSSYRFDPNRLVQAAWVSPVTSRLLLEAGAAATISQWNMYFQPGVTPDIINITDIGQGITYGAASSYLGHPNGRDRFTQRAALSYATGSHNFKVGFQTERLNTNVYYRANGNVQYTFNNGVPISITQRATPYLEREIAKADMGIYAQDQWKVGNQLTLNLGIRWDYFNGYVPEQTAGTPDLSSGWDGATNTNEWLGVRSFARVDNAPNWKDFNPRLGASYDVFGNGRTAIKGTFGRYTAKLGTEIGALINPINTSVTAAARGWNDVNGNFVPDCNLGNFSANGECAAINNQNFGLNNPSATRFNDGVLEGWGKRDFNWDMSLELQHQLREGVGLTAGYYRNTGGYFRYSFGAPFSSFRRVTDNVAVTPADYDTFCVTAPRDSRLPDGGGYQVCGLADIKPAKFGQVQNVVKEAEEFGQFNATNDFFNVTIDARLPRNIRLGGGFDTGRSVAERCFIVDSPQETQVSWGYDSDASICRVVTPFKARSQVKVYGVIPLPYGFVSSFTLQNLPGANFSADYAVTTAEVERTLGRPLSGGTRTVTVPLVAPQTLFGERITRVDLRFSKILNINRYRVQMNLDAYNIANSNGIRNLVGVYGSRWQFANQILDPRLVQLGVQLNF